MREEGAAEHDIAGVLCILAAILTRELPDMMSAKFLGFLSPSPLVLILI